MEETAGNVDRLVTVEAASARGILTIGVIDQGNELGSGLIEEDIKGITPYADMCCCLCGAGIASSVKADVVFPAAISN